MPRGSIVLALWIRWVSRAFECYATTPMLADAMILPVVFTMISAIAIIDHHFDSKRYFLLLTHPFEMTIMF